MARTIGPYSFLTGYTESPDVLTDVSARIGQGALVKALHLERTILALNWIPLRSLYQADLVTFLTTAAATKLGFTAGTHATNTPIISTGDASTADLGARLARFTKVLPVMEDVDHYLCLYAGAAAAATVNNLLDVTAFVSDNNAGKGDDVIGTTVVDMKASFAMAWRAFKIDLSSETDSQVQVDFQISIDANDTGGNTDSDGKIGAIAIASVAVHNA